MDYEAYLNNLKYCTYCKGYLPLDKFSKNSKSKDGLQTRCKSCQSEYHTKWRTEINKEGYNEYMRKYFKERREEDPGFRTISALRSRLSSLVSSQQHSNTFSHYLGCSDEFFQSWLQYQFDEHMCWSNFGTYWVVDHTLPVLGLHFG